jgi:hypothetical protein
MIAIASGALLVTILVIVFLFASGYFYQKKPVVLPVSVISEDTEQILAEAPFQAEVMLKRTTEILSDKLGTSPFIVSWYMLPGSVSTMKEAASDYIITRDQVDLLQAYINLGKEQEARELIGAIRQKLSGPDGYLVSAVRVTDITQKPISSVPELELEEIRFSSSYFDTLLYTRELLSYYERWGTEEGWKQIEYYAGLLYSEQTLVPQDFIIPAPTPTPAPKQFINDNPEVSDQDNRNQEVYEYISLSSLDLSALQALSAADSRFGEKYEQAREILAKGIISDSVPLYATAYDPTQNGYLYISDRKTSFRLAPSLETCLYLAQAERLSAATLTWLKERLENQRIMYETYDVIYGEPSSEREAYEAYAIALAIGVRQDDAALCKAAIDAQADHLATNSNSQAKDMLFRTVQTNRVSVYARENILLILALTTETKSAEKS